MRMLENDWLIACGRAQVRILRRAVTFAVAAMLIPSLLAAQQLQPRIVNGVLTSDFPSTGALLSGSNPSTARLRCSGTLIGCETFLTAAHCVCDTDGADCVGANPPDPSALLVFLQNAGFFTVSSLALQSVYIFPVADVAVLKLGTPVTGIRPVPIDTIGPGIGASGVITGFGRTGGANSDYGIKRTGSVTTTACSDPADDSTSICWEFNSPLGPPGTNSNTCNGDSGGPLFIDYGSGPVVAGVTSGGTSAGCLPVDDSYDARVATYASWIQSQGGADLSNTACGSGPQVGDAAVLVVAKNGQLDSTTSQALYPISITSGITNLRVTLNGVDNGADFDLYVKAGSPPTTTDFDCAYANTGQFGACNSDTPATGTWYVLVDRFGGSGPYQMTATIFGTDCSQPGHEGSPCDDGNQCTDNDTCQSGSCVGTTLGDGAPCDDGNQCTSETCQSGTCVAVPLTGTACDDGSACTQGDLCQAGTCVPGTAPVPVCKQSLIVGKSSVLLKDKASGKDKLVWRWTRGQKTDVADFGDPMSTTSYALCVFDESGATPQLVLERVVSPSTSWSADTTGFNYKDPTGGNAGITKAILKAGDDMAAKIIVKGKGDGLGMSSVGVDQLSSVRVQLLNDAQCWEAHYTGAGGSGLFKAKSD